MPTDLYKTAAWFYARFRPFYPEQEIKDIVQSFKLTKSSRVLDIGSGTGQLAIQLAAHVGEVVAIEPDEEMLNEGKMLCERKGVTNVHWIQSKAEEIGNLQNLGKFNLATFGASFHWMDRDLILQELDKIIAPEGGLVITGYWSIWESDGALEQQIKKVIQSYLGEKRRAGSTDFDALVKKKESYHDTLGRSPFSRTEANRSYIERHTRTLDEMVGYIYSMSFAAPALFGDKKEAFEKDLRTSLMKLNPPGVFERDEENYAFFAFRN